MAEELRRNSIKDVMSKTEMFPRIRVVEKVRPRASSVEVVVEAFQLPLVTRDTKPLDRSKYGQFVGSIGETVLTTLP